MDSYFEGFMTPGEREEIPSPASLSELLTVCCTKYGRSVAARQRELERTYEELGQDTAVSRGALYARGYKKGEHIALWMENEYDLLRAFLAVTSMGCVAVMVPAQTPAGDLPGLCSRMDVVGMVAGPGKTADVPLSRGVMTPAELRCGEMRDAEPVAPEDPAAIIFTGGTTDKGKGALLSHGNLCRGAMNGSIGVENCIGMTYFSLIPLTHVFGLVRCCLSALLTGSQIYFCPDMQKLFKELPAAKPDIMILVPALAEMLAGYLKMRGKDKAGGRLRVIICGGAAVKHSLVEQFWNMGIRVMPGYGLTESSNLVTGTCDPMEAPGSVGVPYSHQELKIVDGELWIRGENVMLGYYNDPIANEAAFRDGWLRTGDLVRFDEKGYLYITGRKKNVLILSNGENVSPEELEERLREIPYIRDCLVYEGKTSWGKPVIAAQILPDVRKIRMAGLEDGEQAIQTQVDALNERLPGHLKISMLTFRQEDFRRDGNMKIIREL